VRFAPLLLLAAGLAAYHNSLDGPFIFDDLRSIRDNPHIRHLWPVADAISAPRKSALNGRPVPSLSFAVNYALGGLNVRGYHTLNLAIHLASALLVYGLVRRTLSEGVLRERYRDVAARLATAVALIWMIHPLLTESVTYIVQRTELLMGFFLLGTLYCFLRALRSSRPRIWFVAAVGSCALGMGCKEVMVVAPLLLFLYDRCFIAGSFRRAWQERWKLHASLAATWLILAPLVIHGQSRTGPASMFLEALTPWSYAKTQCGVILHYLRLSAWPSPLVLDYEDWPVAGSLLSILPAALSIVGLLVATLWALRAFPVWGFLGAWFFLILAPTSSFLPILTEVAAERRMYLPLLAVVLVLVLLVHEALRRFANQQGWRPPARGTIGTALFVAVSASLGFATISRNADYGSELAIWGDTVAKRPSNARARHNLGFALGNVGRLEEAMAQYGEAIRLKPDYANVHFNMGVTRAVQGRFRDAIPHYREAVRLEPGYTAAHHGLGNALVELGGLEEAIGHHREAVRIKPGDPQFRRGLAVALHRQGRSEEAKTHLLEAERLERAASVR